MKRNSGRMTYKEREAHRREIELRLAVFETVRPPGVAVEQAVIADFCGCSRETIRKMERDALEKMRRAARSIER